MRKITILIITTVVLFSLIMTTGLANPGNSMGAVKIALSERLPGDDYYEAGSGGEVGWAIINTTADGRLIVQIHLDKGAASEVFDVYVRINGTAEEVGTLSTNRQGKGNSSFTLDITGETALDVQIVVKVGVDLGTPGYASDTESVPLKP